MIKVNVQRIKVNIDLLETGAEAELLGTLFLLENANFFLGLHFFSTSANSLVVDSIIFGGVVQNFIMQKPQF